MKYLPDTNICIHFFRGKFGLAEKFEMAKAENCAISEITLAELVYGAENSQNPLKNHKLVEQLCEIVSVLPIYDAITIYGKEKARLRKTGNMISDLDLFIGCTAV
jgi:tRNA(fMet)-specific endonuclease VapC